jgi:hypothetical protein
MAKKTNSSKVHADVSVNGTEGSTMTKKKTVGSKVKAEVNVNGTEVATMTKKTVGSKANAEVNVSGDVAPTAATTAPVAAATKEVKATAATTTVTKASPLSDRVAQALSLIQEAADLLALQAPALTATQRKGMNRVRKGGDKLIPQLAQIAQTWSVQIRTQPTAAMTSAMQLATTLQPLIGVLVGFLQETQDVEFQAESDSWSTAIALYSVMKRMSKKDPKLKAQLAPMAEFFKYRHPLVAATTAAAKEGKPPTKTARRDAKALANAEAMVAENAAATAAATPATPATAANGATATPAVHS